MSWRKALAESLEKNPLEEIQEDTGSLVDNIIKVGDDPNIPTEPEDQFGLPKQLNTITKLRKDGWDNARIFKAMELEEAEAASSSTKEPNLTPQKPKPEAVFRKAPPKERGFWATWNESRKRGSQSANLDVQLYDSFHQMPGSVPMDELADIHQKYQELWENDPIQADTWYKYIASASGQLAGSMQEGLSAGIPSATAGLAATAIAGQMGPQAVLPEEIITAPLGFGTGMAIGSTWFFARQGAGAMLRNMLDRGVDPTTAMWLANFGGFAYGMVERMQLTKLVPKTFQGKMNDLIADGITNQIGKWTKEYGTDWATQIGQEEIQLAIEILTTEIGAGLSGKELRTWESIKDEAIETFKQTAAGLAPMQGVRASMDIGLNYGPTKMADVASAIMDTKAEFSTPKVSREEALTVETQAKQINDDKANEFNITYNSEESGDREISEDELLAYGANPQDFQLVRTDEYGNKFYSATVKGENDSQGNISLNSTADRSTVLEEVAEARLKILQNSKNAEDQALVEKIKIWVGSVRKKASEMGLELRFSDTDEGNIELFSDAILYAVGGFKGLPKKFEDAIYIPEDISSEFIAKLGEMSDGTQIFDLLKGSEIGIQANEDFKMAVDEEIASQMEKSQEKVRPPPAKPTTKSKLKKKTKQMVPGENTKTPEFQSWFGKSVLKDELFEPIVMYHGTNENFDEFMPMTYMSPSPNVGSFYARDHRGQRPDPGTDDDGQVYPVYARIENPFDFHSDRIDLGEETNFDEFIFEVNAKLEQDGKEKLSNKESDDIFETFKSYLEFDDFRNPSGLTPDAYAAMENHSYYKFIDLNLPLADALESRGYDGIKANEFILEEENPKVYIAFEPNQIKSAFNQGTFDESNNITYQLEPKVVEKAVSLYPDVDADTGKQQSKAERLQRFLGRLTTRVTKKNPVAKPIPVNKQAGVPLNKSARRVELKNGAIIYVGADKTAEQWIEQVNSVLSQEEQETAANWYEEAYPTFVEHFGEDQAVPYMVAWLMGNVNASPQQALSNMFLGAEQLNADLASFKSAGLPDAAENVKLLLSGYGTEKNAGAKLYDFLDSALGKPSRTIMKDDERGGSPVANDRHTNRDIGFVDATLYEQMMDLAVNPDDVKGIRIDQKATYKDVIDKKTGKVKWKTEIDKKTGKKRRKKVKKRSVPGPSETQYEWGVQKFNKLSKDVNATGYMGGNLQTWQHQAIGWTAIARAIQTSDGMSIPDSFRNQKPTIAFELAFGQNTPFRQKYGDAFDALPMDEKSKLTKKVTEELVLDVSKEIGLKVNSIDGDGMGGWGDATNPSTIVNVMGSDQAIRGLMDVCGYCFEQDGIGKLKTIHGKDGLGFVYYSDAFADNDIIQSAWRILRENTDDKYSPGFSATMFQDSEEGISETPGIMVGTQQSREELNNALDQVEVAVEKIREELGIELDFIGTNVQYEEINNDWQDKKTSKGQDYTDSIRQSFGIDLQKRLDSHYKPRVEQRIQEVLKRDSGKQLKTRQLVPNPDYAAELLAAQQTDKELDLTNATFWKGKVQTWIFDKMYPLVTWQQDIMDQFLDGHRVRDHQNVVLASELYVGKVPEILRDFNKKMIDSEDPNSFLRRLVDSGISTEDFNMYLHALHATERNDKMGEDGLSGMTKQQARTIKSELNKKHGLKNLKTWVKEFRTEVIDKSLQIRLDAGLIDQETVDTFKETYKNYVPLYRVMDNKEAVIDNSKIGMNTFDVKGKEFKKAKGSKRQVKNILVSSIEQYHSAVIRAEKNLVNKRLLSLIESYPSEAFEVSGVKHRPSYDENGEINYMVPIENYQDDQDYIHVKVDGKVKRITFKGEQGLRIAKAMKNLGVSKGVGWMYAFNNYLRYVNTIANPEFMVTNFVRDVQTAGINIGAEQGSSVVTQALSPKNLKNAWKGVYNMVQDGDDSSEWSQLYEKMRQAGGKTGFFDYETIEDKVGKLEKDLKRVESTGRGVKVAGKSIFNFVENLNEATESAVRLTLFKAMLDNGYSTEQAASGAKNVTINFNRKGEIGQWLNSMYLFANAGLQGTHRIFGVVKNNKSAQAAVSGLAAMGFMEAILNNMASDDDEYDKLGDWEKNHNFIIRYGEGDKFFKMRLPYGYNVFKVVGNIAGDMAWKQWNNEPVEPTKQLVRFLEATNSAFNPIAGGDLGQTISPTITDPWVQLTYNRAFHGGPLKPESVYGPEKAEVEQAWERTPGIYKNFGQWYFKKMGGHIRYNEDGSIAHAVQGPMGEWGDVSPETWEFWVDYLGGGLGKTMFRTVNTVQGAVDYNSEWEKAPFIRQFYGKFDKKSENRILYQYEKKMKKRLYDEPTRLKYLAYLQSYYEKGNLTRKEYEERYGKFVKAQREVIRTLNITQNQ